MKSAIRHLRSQILAPLCGIFCLFVLGNAVVRADIAPAETRYRISLLTISPGSEMEERLGHSALAVENLSTGSALAYNFGTFGDSENITEKFLHKQLKFWVSAYNPGEIAVRYRQRQIVTQELRLTDAQASRLAESLAMRVKPENREFDYDLFTANCVTPIRDAIDTAIDGALRKHTSTPSPRSFRQIIMAGFSGMPLLGAFSALIYGPYTDAPHTRWESLFMPDALHDAVAELRIGDAPNAPSFVVREKIWRGDAFEELLPLPNPWFIAAGLGSLIVVALIQLLRRDKRRAAGRFLAFMAATLTLIGGVFGAAIYYLGFMPHASVQDNANRFLLNPLDLAAVPLLLLLSLDRLGRSGTRFLLLILFGTTLIALGHTAWGHISWGGQLHCAQAHWPVVLATLAGRATVIGCVMISLFVAQNGFSPTKLPAGR